MSKDPHSGQIHNVSQRLNYPIKYHHVDHDTSRYGIIHGVVDGLLEVTFPHLNQPGYVNHAWTEDCARNFIKKGIWIVEGSGSSVEAPQSLPATVTLANYSAKFKALAEAANAAYTALDNVKLALEELEE